MENDFCVFILSHGRPDRVITYDTLRNNGYDGPIVIVIDNEDKTADQYFSKFGRENVVVFDKKATAETFDGFDNFDDRRTIVYARNASFEIAERLGYKYFLQLDDDYRSFKYRINHLQEHPKSCPNMRKTTGKMIYAVLDYYKKIPALSIALSQGGDWFGGDQQFGKLPKRKAMNTFFCSTDRPFKFVGRINEDVNTYTWFQSLGNLFFTIPLIQMDQMQTQSNSGGMTDVYLLSGTYIKSFYTVICSPSSVSINMMGRTERRLHHVIDWDSAVPKIISEKYRKEIK